MKKKHFVVLFMLFSVLLIGSKKIPLTGSLPPELMTVDQNQLYVSSGTNISIYSLPDVKLIKNLGRKGEGPGEFISLYDDHGVFLDVFNNKLFVNSRNKISYFSKNGTYLSEVRAINGLFLTPIGDKYVGTRRDTVNNIVYNFVTLFNKNFSIIKDLYKKKHWYQPGKQVDPISAVRPAKYRVLGNLIFTLDGKGNINIFNNKGELIHTTSIQFKSQPVSDQDKAEYHNYYRTHPKYKNAYAQLKSLFKFPDTFPKINYFDVADSNLYVFTFIKKEKKSELYIFDLKGKLKKKIYLDCPEIDPKILYPIVKLKNNKIYQILEDEDDEEIYLQITDINK